MTLYFVYADGSLFSHEFDTWQGSDGWRPTAAEALAWRRGELESFVAETERQANSARERLRAFENAVRGMEVEQ